MTWLRGNYNIFTIMAKKSKENYPAKIKVVGVGGAGGNAVTRMADSFPRSIDLIVINTDIQDLNHAQARKKIHIGKNLTRGLGTGMNPEIGQQAAEEDRAEIAEALKGADMVFIAAGFGGGTGTGATPIVAEIAKELGILTIAVVTKPFGFEGSKRAQIAQDGIARVKEKVDTLIAIPNDKIFSIINKETSLIKAFEAIDEVLKNAVLGITELIISPGIVNVDFADVKAIMSDAGASVIGIGRASGRDRASVAATQAINSPLLEMSIDGAKGILFGISGQRDLKMSEINEAANLISENIDPGAKIIFGAYHNRRLNKGQLKITLIATGFNGNYGGNGDMLSQNLFSPRITIREEIFEEPAANGSLFEESEKSAKKSLPTGRQAKNEKEKSEDILDMPAFLRKRRK